MRFFGQFNYGKVEREELLPFAARPEWRVARLSKRSLRDKFRAAVAQAVKATDGVLSGYESSEEGSSSEVEEEEEEGEGEEEEEEQEIDDQQENEEEKDDEGKDRDDDFAVVLVRTRSKFHGTFFELGVRYSEA